MKENFKLYVFPKPIKEEVKEEEKDGFGRTRKQRKELFNRIKK